MSRAHWTMAHHNLDESAREELVNKAVVSKGFLTLHGGWYFTFEIYRLSKVHSSFPIKTISSQTAPTYCKTGQLFLITY